MSGIEPRSAFPDPQRRELAGGPPLPDRLLAALDGGLSGRMDESVPIPTPRHRAPPRARRAAGGTRAGAVLVVIPMLDEAGTIQDVLEDLFEDLPLDRDVRFVVADGGSTDGSADIVRRFAASHPNLRLLDNPKRLQSAGVNLAVQRFGHDAEVLVRCDAHARYPCGFVRRLTETLVRTGADAVVVPMDSIGETCTRRAIGWVADSIIGSGGSSVRARSRSGFVEDGHHAAFRLASFVRAGGYDETFRQNEDAELDCRQRAIGNRIYLDGTIRVQYLPRSTLCALARQYFRYGRGRARTVGRHPGSLRPRQLAVPINLAMIVAGIALAPWLPWLLAWPAAYVLALAGTAAYLAYSHRSLCGLLCAPAAAAMHLSWASGFLIGIVRGGDARWTPEETQPLEFQPAALAEMREEMV